MGTLDWSWQKIYLEVFQISKQIELLRRPVVGEKVKLLERKAPADFTGSCWIAHGAVNNEFNEQVV